jgi:hypothetical protein
MVSVIDFVENYSCEIQNKVQSMHWHSYQYTILVHISWIWNPHPHLDDENSMTVMKCNFYIFDAKIHDGYFV